VKARTKAILRNVIPSRAVKSLRMLIDPNRYVSARSWAYSEDGLATEHNCDFMRDPLFLESYNLGKATGSWGTADIHWRAYVVCWAADKAKMLDGDFVECGVYRGGYARTVVNYVNFKTLNKKFYLLDTFAGLCDKYITAEERKLGMKGGTTQRGYEDCYDSVVRTFSDWNVKIIKGAIPETLPLVDAKKICYLSIDMNCVTPEIAAAEFFWEKMVSGAVMVLDDYGWPGHQIQKQGFDEFARNRKVRVLALPTGQGLVFKP
jgi:O-methyltransferase